MADTETHTPSPRLQKSLVRIRVSTSMTSFAQKVYKAVLSIPLGEVRTYKWVAKKAGSPNAYRAVGAILKNNPYPLIIPCHRVVKSNNELGGYSRGKRSKKTLLDLERQIRNSML